MRLDVVKRGLFTLSVDIDEKRADAFEQILGDELAVEEYAVLTRQRKFAADDEIYLWSVVKLDTAFLKSFDDGGCLRDGKEPLYLSRLFALLNEIRIDPVARQSSEAVYDYRFPGSCLTSQ